jgi:hypothetical protein
MYAPVVTCRAFLMVISIHSKAHAKSTLAFTFPNLALHQSVAYNSCSYHFAVICMAEGSNQPQSASCNLWWMQDMEFYSRVSSTICSNIMLLASANSAYKCPAPCITPRTLST